MVEQLRSLPGDSVDRFSAIHAIGALGERDAGLLRDMAGYRNRLVHFYSEVTAQELFHIRSSRLTDIETVLSALLCWIQAHPELIDQS